MCGIIGVYKHEGNANVEIYEGLLMLQVLDISFGLPPRASPGCRMQKFHGLPLLCHSGLQCQPALPATQQHSQYPTEPFLAALGQPASHWRKVAKGHP
jgi:hypothetical protein